MVACWGEEEGKKEGKKAPIIFYGVMLFGGQSKALDIHELEGFGKHDPKHPFTKPH